MIIIIILTITPSVDLLVALTLMTNTSPAIVIIPSSGDVNIIVLLVSAEKDALLMLFSNWLFALIVPIALASSKPFNLDRIIAIELL